MHRIFKPYHAPFRLTLSYPSDWRSETLDTITPPLTPEYLPEGYSREEDTEGYKTVRNRITLHPPTFRDNPLDEIYIFINYYYTSPAGDLSAIVQLQNEVKATGNPFAESMLITVTRQTLPGVDDVVVMSSAHQLGHSETIWLAKDGLVYGVVTFSDNPSVIAAMHEIVATFQFDDSIGELFEAYKKYLDDADGLRESIEAIKPKPQPECDIVCQDEKAIGEKNPMVRSSVAHIKL
jgi:hypothetical protein